MFPVAQGLAFGVGEGLEITGAIGAAQAQKGYYQSQQNIAALEQQTNEKNHQLQELTFNRSKLQALRNAQQSRSLALAANVGETGSGTQRGSAYGGALGGIGGEYGTNVTSISQNEQIANAEYEINNSISAQKQQSAKYQGEAAMWQGIGSIGKDLAGSSAGLGSLFPNSMFG